MLFFPLSKTKPFFFFLLIPNYQDILLGDEFSKTSYLSF